MEFNDWLKTQRMHQEISHGVNHRDLACDPYQMSRYVLTQMHSALDTMETARMNIPSHGVEETVQRKAWEDNRSAFVDNIVSMLTCVGSMLTAVGCTDEDLAGRYQLKVETIHEPGERPVCGTPLPFWRCGECKRMSSPARNPYALSGDTPLCSVECLKTYDRAELVLVPAPNVSAVDLTDDEDDEGDEDLAIEA